MKKTLSVLLLLAAVQIANAQVNNITGMVQDDKGKPLHDVFILDGQYKNATFSDSTGNFSIAVHPGSKLFFQRAGFKDTSLATVQSNVQIAMRPGGNAGVASSAGSSGTLNTSETLTKNEVAVISNDMGGYLKPAHENGTTRGSQYLFETFVHGYLVNKDGEIVYYPLYLFDYDKIGGYFLMTKDNKSMINVDWDLVQSFTLFSNTDKRFDFEKAPAIDKSHYVQVLASGKKYKIYKLIQTRFAKADYVNNGAAPHGHDYDEYIDEPDYYVVDLQTNQPKKFSLRKSPVKAAFGKEADKAGKFMSDNSGSINDDYLGKLGDYMNQ